MPTNDQVNEDLQRERSKCNFNVEEITHYLDGGADATNKRRDIGELKIRYSYLAYIS